MSDHERDAEGATILPFRTLAATNDNGNAALHFPEVYRLEGYAEIKRGRARKGVPKLPKLVRRLPGYTFNDAESFGFVKPTWTPIHKMDPKVDEGWVIVRYHYDDSHIEGYIDSQIDRYFDEEDVHAGSQVMSNEYGVFTLTHRLKARGAPDHLLVHVWADHAEMPLSTEQRLKWPNRYVIYHPDGSVTYDNRLLYPFTKPAK